MTPQTIAFKDIKAGDTIKASTTDRGVARELIGKVEEVNTLRGIARTAEGCDIWNSGWLGAWNFELLDRPEPKPVVLKSYYASGMALEVKSHADQLVKLEVRDNGVFLAGITVDRAELRAAIS